MYFDYPSKKNFLGQNRHVYKQLLAVERMVQNKKPYKQIHNLLLAAHAGIDTLINENFPDAIRHDILVIRNTPSQFSLPIPDQTSIERIGILLSNCHLATPKQLVAIAQELIELKRIKL